MTKTKPTTVKSRRASKKPSPKSSPSAQRSTARKTGSSAKTRGSDITQHYAAISYLQSGESELIQTVENPTWHTPPAASPSFGGSKERVALRRLLLKVKTRIKLARLSLDREWILEDGWTGDLRQAEQSLSEALELL